MIGIFAILIKKESKGPVFFAHERVGQNGKKIPTLKFRSMYSDAKERLETLLQEDEQIKELILSLRKNISRKILEEIIEKYTEPHRSYHNLSHIYSMLMMAEHLFISCRNHSKINIKINS